MMITKTTSPFKFVWRAFFGGLLALTGAMSSIVSSVPAAASTDPNTPVRATVQEPQPFLPLARSQSTSVTAPASAQPIGPVRSPQASPLVACTTLTVTPNYVSGQPSISHDGKRIAFWSTGSFAAPGLNADGNIEVFLYDQPGAKFTQVTSSTGSILGGFNLWPSISGDGTRLAFASDRNLTGGNGDGNFEIFTADLSGSGAPTLTQLTTTTVGVNTSPSMSGDGTRVAFVSNRDLLPGLNADQNTEVFIAAIAGAHLLTYTQLTNSQGDIVNDEPSINNNGTAAAYIARGTYTSTIYLSATPFNAPKAIGAAGLSVDVHPAISADGQRVIFVSDMDLVPGKNVSRTQQLFLYDNTAGLRQLTVTGNSADRCSPALSGNGLRVACVSDDQNVYLYSAATGTRGQLTSGGVNADPTINSDGQVIAYSQNGQIYSSVCPVADISLSKAGSPGTAKALDPLQYTLVVSNAGPGIAQNVIISDPLPGGVLLDDQFVPDQIDNDHSTTGFIDAGMFGVSYQNGLPGLQLNSSTNAYELPNSAANTGWQDMTGNALLLHLNEQSGTSFSNSAPAGGAATCPYGPSTTCPTLAKPGRLTTALGFNGTTDSAAYPDSGNLLNYGFNSDFTVMAWVNPGPNQASTSPADNSIIEKWDASGGGYPFVIRMFNQSAGSNAGLLIAARYDTYNNPALYSTTKVNDNRWHHVAFVKRGGLLSLYVDGNQQSTIADTTGTFPCGFFGISCSTANNSAVYLGSRGGTSNKYSGGLDEVAIFSRGLADAEVHNIYNHQSQFQNYLGYYQSRQIDAGRAVNWNTLSWRSTHPIQLQLPDNGMTETDYTSGNVNMTGNVALYHFSEANPYAGLADSSGNNNRAYAVYYYPNIGAGGVYANAIGFTGGALQGIRAPDSPSLRVGTSANSLTVEAWVNLRDAGANQKIVGKTPIGAGWLLGVGNHQIYAEVWQAPFGQHFVIQNGFIPDNQWTHLMMSWSSVGTTGSWHFRAYVNGQMVGDQQTCSSYCTGILDTAQPLVIGSAPWDMSSYVVNGNIDEIAIYNRELTQAEVQDHYKRGAARLMFQARTCSAACSTESFTGPDGTPNTYYTVQPSPSVTQSVSINVPPNPVFQYQAVLDTQDTSVLPDVTYVAVDPPHGAANASQGACALGVPVVCNVGTLNPGQLATVTIGSLLSQTVAAGQLPNTALTYSDADDINPTNNVATATTTIIQNVTLSILKTVTPQHAAAFQQITYTLTITNNGSSPATNVVVSDTLPQEFLPQSATSSQFACPISGGVMRCTAGSLVGTATIMVPGKVVPSTNGIVVNTALVTSSEYYTGAMSTVTLTVPVLVDLGVKQDPTPATDAGAKLIYSVTVTNSNVSTAPNVVVNDTLDPDVTFVDGTPGANCTTGSLSSVACTLGNVAPGASVVFTIGVQIRSGATGSIANTVQVDSSGSDSNPSNNQDTVNTTLTTHADLVVVKTGPSTVSAGDSLQYTLAITNNGPSDARNVYITDTLPAGVSVNGVSSNLPFGLVAKTTTAALHSWFTSTVPAQSHGQFVLTVQVTNTNAPAMITNTLSISSATAEVDTADNRSVLATTVSAVAPGGVTIPSGITCLLGRACVITGTVNPANASLPITFTWDATGYPQRVVVANSITGTVIFTFTTLGNQPISVQADNSGGFGNGSGSVTVVAADLSLNKTGPASVSAGGVIQYTLTFSNSGTTSAQSVTIVDLLPAALTFGNVVGSLPSGFTQVGTGASGVITFTAITLPADSVARSIVFNATVSNHSVPSQVVNSAQITTTTPDSQSGNNADTATTTINPVTISSVSITPPGSCSFNSDCTFTAAVSPGMASTPITFSWQAPDGNPTSASASVSSITNQFTSKFNVHGTVYITVTASAYSVSATRGITIAIP